MSEGPMEVDVRFIAFHGADTCAVFFFSQECGVPKHQSNNTKY
jgi:hypothetical protein